MVGEYNFDNFLAAYTVGKFFKTSEKKVFSALESYKPKNNRSEKQTTIKKNKVIWDCYNANPNPMELAVKSFLKKDGEKVFILGDMKELGKYSEIEHKKVLKTLEKKRFEDFSWTRFLEN